MVPAGCHLQMVSVLSFCLWWLCQLTAGLRWGFLGGDTMYETLCAHLSSYNCSAVLKVNIGLLRKGIPTGRPGRPSNTGLVHKCCISSPWPPYKVLKAQLDITSPLQPYFCGAAFPGCPPVLAFAHLSRLLLCPWPTLGVFVALLWCHCK